MYGEVCSCFVRKAEIPNSVLRFTPWMCSIATYCLSYVIQASSCGKALTLERACAKSGLFLTWYKPLSMRPSPFRHMWICLAMINVLLPRKFGMCLTAIKVPFRASQCSVVQLLCTLKTNLYTEDFTWWIFNIVKSGIILTFFGLFC